jgi:hypothetical protein
MALAIPSEIHGRPATLRQMSPRPAAEAHQMVVLEFTDQGEAESA